LTDGADQKQRRSPDNADLLHFCSNPDLLEKKKLKEAVTTNKQALTDAHSKQSKSTDKTLTKKVYGSSNANFNQEEFIMVKKEDQNELIRMNLQSYPSRIFHQNSQ